MSVSSAVVLDGAFLDVDGLPSLIYDVHDFRRGGYNTGGTHSHSRFSHSLSLAFVPKSSCALLDVKILTATTYRGNIFGYPRET